LIVDALRFTAEITETAEYCSFSHRLCILYALRFTAEIAETAECCSSSYRLCVLCVSAVSHGH